MKKLFEQPDFELIRIYNETVLADKEPNASWGTEDFSEAPNWN